MAVRRSLAWTSFGQGGFFVLQFIGSIILARLLGPYDMGVFAVALAVVGVISVVQSLGLNSYLIRERNLTPEHVSTAATVNLFMAIGMSVVIAGLGLLGGSLFKEAGVRQVLLVLAVVPIIGQFSFVPNAMLEREGNFRTLASIKLVSTAIGLCATVTLAFFGYRYMSFAYSQLATALLTNIILNLIARRHWNFRLSLAHWSTISKFGAQIFAISAMTRIASRAMEIVLGRTLGLASLGVYSRASSNHNMLWDGVHGAVGSVILVDFAKQVREGTSLRDRYLQVLELMTGLMWPMFAGVAVLSRPLVTLVYGDAWTAAALPLMMLCVASILLVSTTMVWELFVVRGETARQVRLEVMRTVFGTTLFIVCCFYSLAAAAASRIAEAVFAQFMYRPHLERMTGAPRRAFLAVYLRSGLAAAAAVLPAAGLMIAHRFSAHVPLPELVAVVAAGGILWLVALALLRHPLYRELSSILNRVRRMALPA